MLHFGQFTQGSPTRAGVHPVELEDAAAKVRAQLLVEPVRDSRLVVVNFDDANPDRARRILSSLIDIFLERNVDQSVESNGAASEWLHEQTEKLKDELEKSELALHAYKQDKQILSVSLDDQSNMLRGQMQQLSEALTHVAARREELRAHVNELDKIDFNQPTNVPATELLGNPLLSGLRQNYVQACSEFDAILGSGKGEKHPSAEAAKARVDATRESLVREVQNVQGAVRGDLEAATHEQQGLSGLLEKAKQRALDLNMLEIEYRRLERTKANTEKLYGVVLERSKETELTGMLRFNNIRTIEKATVGRSPIRPRIAFNLAVGLLVGIGLGLATALARSRIDQSIRVPQEIESELNTPLLGVIPSLSGRAKSGGYYSKRRHSRSRNQRINTLEEGSLELLTHTLPNSHAAECARVIRTSLTFASPDKPYRKILITSGRPSEGKTTVAVTLAIAFAQAGQRVLLLDCDLRRARLHRIFGIPNNEGVSTSLQDRTELEQSIKQTQVPNLSVLPGGPHLPNPAEVVQSDSFQRMLDELSLRYDRIVIDSPPILVVADASILATRADVTVLVARAVKTRFDVTAQVLHKLRELGVPLAGIVLNGLDAPRWGTNYYYYYSYYGKQEYGTYGVRNEA